MKISLKLLSIATLGLTLLTPTLLQAAPKPFQASYAVMKSGMKLGVMNSTLNIGNNQYNYQKLTQANGLARLVSGDRLTERVQGQLQGANMLPLNYLHHHKNRRKDRRDQFQFTSRTQVKGSYKNTPYELTVAGNTIDPATMELRLMEDVAANRPLRYQIVEKGEQKQYTFQRLGNETLRVPAGEYPCVKVRVVRNGGERETTLWLASTLNFIPVKMRHNEEGDIIETQLLSYQAR